MIAAYRWLDGRLVEASDAPFAMPLGHTAHRFARTIQDPEAPIGVRRLNVVKLYLPDGERPTDEHARALDEALR